MIDRYTLPEMAALWSEEKKLSTWLKVEVLACEAWAQRGKIPKTSLDKIKAKAGFNLRRMAEIEEEVQHDIIAFLSSISEGLGRDSRFIHMGLTSSDVLDTALAVMMKEASELIISSLEKLISIFREKAKAYKKVIMMGRTHGVHAEPITVGLKFALMYEEFKRDLERLKRAKETISFGKISGAVGTYANVPPEIEEYVCKKLDLKPSPISTQIIQRDRHAEYLSTLAIIASSLDKYCLEIRGLQKTEILELEEPFGKGQKGSSAMPHKRNPVLCERICGLARILRANALAGFEDIVLWHERDISHSSVERIIIPDSTTLLHYMLEKFIYVIENLNVYPENMKENIDKSKNRFFSQRVMLALVQKGLTREESYRLVQAQAMKSWKTGSDFAKLVKNDKNIRQYLKEKDIKNCFNLKASLSHTETIFRRLGI